MQCTQCEEFYFLKNYYCRTECGGGYLGIDDTCYSCTENCLVCTGVGDDCTECKYDYYLHEGVCLGTCPD